jgi:hypothetical protein
MTNVPRSATSLQFMMQQKEARHFLQLTLPRCRARMTGPPAVVLRACGRASNLAAVPGRLRVRSRLRGVSPCAHLILSPTQPDSLSSTRHNLLPGEPNAVTSALPSTGDSAAFSSLVLVGSQFGFSAAPGPSQRYRCRSPVPLSPATVFLV